MIKTKQTYHRVINFHKANWKEITSALSLSFLYSFCSMGLVSVISLRDDMLVLLSMMIYYPLLSIFVTRPKYKTLYGKITSKIFLITGGFLGYLSSEWIVESLK